MRKIALLLGFCALLAACESGAKKEAATDASVKAASSAELTGDSATASNVSAVDHQLQADTSVSKIGTEHTGGVVAVGAKLMAASDCVGCHKEREKLVGPAYVAIAQKYPATEANVAMLAGKIISGGKGHWGEIPMTPHPGLSVGDAKEMTKYILSLK
ncbi:c-type cytochrome [Hymenobacter caeli]|uniref:Cytochrome c n=1 Tax=Hymenobacter caeli TaxID=2735894 RepID=A0ABX2FKP3_9BACT|nr:c-type cytochrome [Hymenobacter caeli]NRT17700.1 cytochrome c [Hymenobacter caeli]